MKLVIQRVSEASVAIDGETKGQIGRGFMVLISQFTLYANCKKGNRPSFIEAGAPDQAEALYEYIVEECKKAVPIVETGEFGADMKVSLTNDGPFTVILDESIL